MTEINGKARLIDPPNNETLINNEPINYKW